MFLEMADNGSKVPGACGGLGFEEQIFGADEQNHRRRRRHLRSVRPSLCRADRAELYFDPLCHFSVYGSDEQMFGADEQDFGRGQRPRKRRSFTGYLGHGGRVVKNPI
jgi:hypothetical protein